MQMPARGPAAPASRLRRLLREPLLHFLLAGLALFVLYRALNPASAERDSSNQIRLTEDDLVQMTIMWRAQGRPPPTPEQIKSLVETKVREEVLFREALALGLDKNDTIVKRRMAQKMEFLAEDLSGIGDPKPDELKAWFAANADRFAFPPRASFRHLYFSPDRRGERAQADASRALEKLGGKPADSTTAAKLADPFMFQDYYGDRSFDQLASVFGPQFAQALLQLKPGIVAGPGRIRLRLAPRLDRGDDAQAHPDLRGGRTGGQAAMARRAARRDEAQGIRGDALALRGGAA